MVESVALRRVRREDEEFLQTLYATTREEELAATGWTEEQKRLFCRMQFDAQAAHYREHYPGAEFSVIECDGVLCGRLYVNRGPEEIRIMDLAILPEWRGRGTGTELLQGLQNEAAAVGKELSIHVEKFNPALRLYERLGFQPVEDRGVYLLLKWGKTAVS